MKLRQIMKKIVERHRAFGEYMKDDSRYRGTVQIKLRQFQRGEFE